MFSSFCSQEELQAAMNDETQPPFAEAELADPDLLPDIPSASVSWMLEYENRLAHVNALVQARQAKAAQAAQPQQAGPKRGRGRPRKNGRLPSLAVLRAAKKPPDAATAAPGTLLSSSSSSSRRSLVVVVVADAADAADARPRRLPSQGAHDAELIGIGLSIIQYGPAKPDA